MEIELNSQNFDEEIKSGVTLVDFWAPWCGPCQAMLPILEEIAKEMEGKVKVGKVNVDENQELAQKFNVMSIPNLKIFKDGKEVENFVGVQSKEDLIASIEKALA